jgi:YEATS domain-containing protein 1/3
MFCETVIKEPPYQVSESGYAGFELPVEVYFKNREEPKKICFDYDLYLRLDDAVSNTRREKLTFQNPSNDFKKKLLKAGGVSIKCFIFYFLTNYLFYFCILLIFM